MATETKLSRTIRGASLACMAAALVGVTIQLAACDKDVSSSKTTTTKKTETPEGTTKTTESTEKKVETDRKDPPPPR